MALYTLKSHTQIVRHLPHFKVKSGELGGEPGGELFLVHHGCANGRGEQP